MDSGFPMFWKSFNFIGEKIFILYVHNPCTLVTQASIGPHWFLSTMTYCISIWVFLVRLLTDKLKTGCNCVWYLHISLNMSVLSDSSWWRRQGERCSLTCIHVLPLHVVRWGKKENPTNRLETFFSNITFFPLTCPDLFCAALHNRYFLVGNKLPIW